MTFRDRDLGARLRRAVWRWAANVAIAGAFAAALNLVLIVTGGWGETWSTNPAAVLLVGTYLSFMYAVLVPSIATLALVEFAIRLRARRGRRLAIVVGACVGGAYPGSVFLDAGLHSGAAPTAVILLPLALGVAIGGGYGSLIRLPRNEGTPLPVAD